MANHAYIIPETMPTHDEVEAFVREILERKFPTLELKVTKAKDCWDWCIYQSDGKIIQQFGFGEYDGKPCVEFRHGHGADFYWWVEYEIREPLAIHLKARCIDDGCVDYEPQAETFDTLREYMDTIYKGRSPEYNKLLIQEHNEFLPDDLKPLLGI